MDERTERTDAALEPVYGGNCVPDDPPARFFPDGDGCTPRHHSGNTHLRLFRCRLQLYVSSASKPGKAVLKTDAEGCATVCTEPGYK